MVIPATHKPTERPIIDLGVYARQCYATTLPQALRELGDSLRVSPESLRRLCVGWSRGMGPGLSR